MGTISDCLHLKVNLKKTFFYMLILNSTTQRYPKNIFKTSLINDFFHLPLISRTLVVHLELRIYPRIFGKIRNGPNGILRGLGKIDSWKNLKSKISWHCPFKVTVFFNNGCDRRHLGLIYIELVKNVLTMFLQIPFNHVVLRSQSFLLHIAQRYSKESISLIVSFPV